MASREQDVAIERLKMLGLSTAESRAYLTIVRLGMSTVVQIAHEAQLHRTEIYRLVDRLISFGLIEETLDKPRRYRAARISDALRALCDRATARATAIAEESPLLITALEAMRNVAPQKDESHVRVITGVDNIRKSFYEMLASARKEVWVILRPQQTSSPRLDRSALEIIESKGLRAQVIVQVEQSNLRQIKRLASSVEIRHHTPLGVHLSGIDDRHVAMGLSVPNAKLSQEIVADYPDYVRTVRGFFDALWNQSTPLDIRIGELSSKVKSEREARILWGRRAVCDLTADWHRRAATEIVEITTDYGPVRLAKQFEKEVSQARKMEERVKSRWKVICHPHQVNRVALEDLKELAQVRVIKHAFPIGIMILDRSEAVIHHVQPDSPDLAASGTDVGLHLTHGPVVAGLQNMLDSIWNQAVPLENMRAKSAKIKLSA
jgi:sugar-specific transcriptional regulator TrmB